MKTKTLLFIILTGLIQVHLISQTNVGGTLSNDSTWTVEGSPYVLTSIVEVPPGITLTVNPGVQISGDYDLQVKGTFITNGKADSLIEIQKTRVLFKSTNLSNSEMSYVFFNNGRLQLADETYFEQDIVKNSGTLTLSDCKFDNHASARTAGYSTGAQLLLQNASIKNSVIMGQNSESEMITINNSKISNCDVYSYLANNGVNFNNSSLENDTLITGAGSTNMTFENSTVLNSTIWDGGGTYERNFRIINSIFINSPASLPSVRFTILNSIIYNQTSSISIKMGTGLVENSLFIGGDSTNSIFIAGFERFDIGDNTHINNSTFIQGSEAIIIGDFYDLKIDSCNFHTVKNYAIRNNSSTDVQAFYNWWGTSNPSEIPSKIYDKTDNKNVGQVDYSNYFSYPDTTDPISTPINIFKSQSGNGVTVTWNSNPETDISGYKIYYNPVNPFTYANSIDVGNDTSYTISRADLYDTIVVTAYDNGADGNRDFTEGHESWYSQPAKLYFTNDLLTGNSYCTGEEIQYQVNTIADFKADNKFIIQLSDTAGSFNNPTDLITVDTSGSNLLRTFFPDSILYNKQYYIRVKSTNPEASSAYDSVIFYRIPTSEYSLSTKELCYTDTAVLTYTGTASDKAKFYWNFDSGTILSGTGAGPYKIMWNNSGKKRIYLHVHENVCGSFKYDTITVKPQILPVSICRVGVDSANRNVILWEQPTDSSIDSVLIYRETSQPGIYKKIGSRSVGDIPVFTDEEADPSQNSSRYKITMSDTCGCKASMSDPHKTIHLAVNYITDGAWKLTWDSYEGFNYGSYSIYRGTLPDNLYKIAEQMSSYSLQYTDLNPPSGTAYYQIGVSNPYTCNISNPGSTETYYKSSRSNIVNTDQVSSVNNITPENIIVYSNPADDKLYIRSTGTLNDFDIEILSLDGRILIQKHNQGQNSTIDISNLQSGIYIIRLTGDRNSFKTKLIKR